MIFRFLSLSLFIFLFSQQTGYCEIAFVANIEGNWELFMTDDQGNNPQRLTQTAYDEKDPSWSADRKKIVYASSDGLLHVIDIDNKKTHAIADSLPIHPKISPCFSPDGQEIIFAQMRSPSEGDDTDLLVYNLHSDSTRRLLDQFAIQMWPAWSPDGNRIVYANLHCSAECGKMIQELWIADAQGKWARQLLMTHAFCQQPVWSPDGRKIAFASNQSGNFDIWVVDLKDWRMEQITSHAGLDVKPAWSPDGEQLAFVSTRSGLMEIWIKDLQRGTLWPLKPFKDRKVKCKDVAW